MYNNNKNIFFRFSLALLALIFILCSSCGFQGRKYTTGHYWDGRNEIDFNKLNEKQNENEKTKNRESILIEHRICDTSKIIDTNKTKAVELRYETSEKTGKNFKSSWYTAADTIIPNEIPIQENNQKLNVDITPHEIDDQKKALDEQILYTIALSVLLGGLLFFSLIAILLHIPELTPFSTILLLIADVIWYKLTIKLNHSCKKLAHDLKPFESENSDKKWYRKIMSSMDSDWFIRIGLILGYLIFNYLFVSLIIQYS